MILREIKNMYIKNRLTEGVDFVRKEYLKGTGGCYIDTLINPAWNDQLSATTEVSGRPTVHNPIILFANGTNTQIGFKLGGAWYEKNIPQILAIHRVAGKDEYYEYVEFPSSAEIYISLKVTNNAAPITSCKINGATLEMSWRSGTNIITSLPDTTYKIGRESSGLDVLKLKSVNINSHNFVPCQLLHAIPASLDANNRARQAGECGMYDSVSGKFYGNVNNTGTFTVEGDVEPENNSGLQQIYQNRLIEGVDYETADWLKGDGIINYDKPIDYLSDNLRIKIRNLDSNSGYNTIWVGGDTNSGKSDWSRCIIDFEFVNGVSARQVQWCEYVYRNGYYRHFPLSSDNIYTFDININRAIINGVTYSMTSSRCNVTTPFVITLRKADSIAYCKLNNVDMYPCQLLRSIPRNLDAQCKERQAGECGMIDLISGKFHGNVANSGTFTIENDSNE